MLWGAIKIAFTTIIVYKVTECVLMLGIHLHYQKHYPGLCKQVKGLEYGSEDLQITSYGLAFITSGIWAAQVPSTFMAFLMEKNIQGSIYLYDFNKPDLGARKLKLTTTEDFNPKTFHPHGISLLEDKVRGEHLLYIINHREDSNDAVEKFQYLPKTNELVHLKSFSSDKLHVTNDLAVIAEDKFYITNYLYFRNHALSILEHTFLPFNLGSVLLYDGTNFIQVDSYLNTPNGLFLSKDKRYLYVNLFMANTVKVYERKDENSLAVVQTLNLHAGADNLHLSQSGDALYTGAHPIKYKLLTHMYDPIQKAPSSILRLPLKDGTIDAENITELLYDHGDLISGSSVAAAYNNELLVGSIIHKLVICQISSEI